MQCWLGVPHPAVDPGRGGKEAVLSPRPEDGSRGGPGALEGVDLRLGQGQGGQRKQWNQGVGSGVCGVCAPTTCSVVGGWV